jgi:hypothetical protein
MHPGPKDVDSVRPKRQERDRTASGRLNGQLSIGEVQRIEMSSTRLGTCEQHGTKHQLVKNDSFTAPEQGHKYPK